MISTPRGPQQRTQLLEIAQRRIKSIKETDVVARLERRQNLVERALMQGDAFREPCGLDIAAREPHMFGIEIDGVDTCASGAPCANQQAV